MDASILPKPAGFDTTVYEKVRENFPFFNNNEVDMPVFMENAGGSQVPSVVISAVAHYMANSYAQLGAGYPLSQKATETVACAHKFMKVFMNAEGVGEVCLGPSSSQLLANLSDSYGRILKPGDEIIVQEANHEANAGAWVKMAKRGGLTLKFWKVDPNTLQSSLDHLVSLLSPSTKIVAVTHVSNVLGEILDLERVVKTVKEKVGSQGVRIVADGVAYAPHRAVDVSKWGVDWYVFSTYKVYGPHMSALFGTFEALDEVKEEGPNFFFIDPNHHLAYKFELGGPSHEGCAGIVALSYYLEDLARIGETIKKTDVLGGQDFKEVVSLGEPTTPSQNTPGRLSNGRAGLETDKSSQKAMHLSSNPKAGGLAANFDRTVVEKAFATMIMLEQPLQKALVQFLKSKRDVVIVGPATADLRVRLPTISFIHKTKTSTEIVSEIHKAGIAVRNGHMYAYRLVAALVEGKKLFANTQDDGVVRVSMVHYNTPFEVALLIRCLDTVL